MPVGTASSYLGARCNVQQPDLLRQEWCRRGESNPRPRDYETLALPLSYAGTGTTTDAKGSLQEVSRRESTGFYKPGIATQAHRLLQAFT
jgi:hypothetical protein